jgi:purine-nucleoside phosphorylase
VAQVLLDEPRMFNHSRGLWGYTGRAPDGDPLTIQSTGMGGPSAAIVTEELVALGARRLVRIGTCGGLLPELEFGDLLAAESVLPYDGASAALGADDVVHPDRSLTRALVAAGARPATIVSTDLFYGARPASTEDWTARGAAAVEMEAAALLRVTEMRGAAAGCVVAVTDLPGRDGSRRIPAEELERVELRLGEVGYAALATAVTTP